MYFLLSKQRVNPKYGSHLKWIMYKLKANSKWYIKVYNGRYWAEKEFDERPKYLQTELFRLKEFLIEEIIQARQKNRKG